MNCLNCNSTQVEEFDFYNPHTKKNVVGYQCKKCGGCYLTSEKASIRKILYSEMVND